MTALFGRAIARMLCLVAAALVASAAFAQSDKPLRGVALVIGESDYEHLPKLANPANDADAIEALLADLGFDSVRRADRSAANLKRDLDRFVEDAEGADVAVLYYSGHGIEAGGENFLVPVDADLSALDAAGEKLVALTEYVARLKATVPVAILMLDACRDNPFPKRSAVRLNPDAAAAPIGAAGLAETRGATALKPPGTSRDQSLGTVIAFAAEPGKAALDGEPGGNSPYAAAVVRHLDAMAGEEFGTVMRMVAEEVYLKTAGRQRPWINESLRRLLYFGKVAEAPAGEEGDILKERRQLLITISALPDFDRRQVETTAAAGGVPMDALYGMLRTLGADTPKDPLELDRLLRGQTEKLKQLLAERAALQSTDAEIVRLSKLADQAVAEGALKTAISLHERAKARVAELEKTVAKAEADIRARRIEFAEVFARSAEAYELNFEYIKAADDYDKAFAQVERWDDKLAWTYKRAEMSSLVNQGDFKGDHAALERGLAVGEQQLRIAEASKDRKAWRATQGGLGVILGVLGEQEQSRARLEQSLAASRLALAEYDRKAEPLDWANAQVNVARALGMLGTRTDDAALMQEGVAAYEAALEEIKRDKAPTDWASAKNNLGHALLALGNLTNDPAWLMQAADAYLAALEENTRERDPLGWAMVQANIGATYVALVERTSGFVGPEHAVEAYRAALSEFSRERMPAIWAKTESGLCSALTLVGKAKQDTAQLEEAVGACREALAINSRELAPYDWAGTQTELGQALQAIGEREKGAVHLEEAADAFRAALEVWTRESLPFGWAWVRTNLGDTLVELGRREKSRALVMEGKAALDEALEFYKASGYSDNDGDFPNRMAKAARALAEVK